MAKLTIDLGTQGGADGTGDSIRTAGAKINSNFDELYATSAVLSHINIEQNVISATLSNADIVLKPAGTGHVSFPAIKFNDNNIETTRTNDNINLVPAGTGSVIVESIGIKDNTITTNNSNADIELSPSGSGVVAMSNLMIDSSIQIKDNVIEATRSNDDLVLESSGTGSVSIDNIDMNEGTVDNTVIGAGTASTATFSTLTFNPAGSGSLSTTGITVTDNTIKTTQSNDDLELNGRQAGLVYINGLSLPNADGAVGQLLQTNGSGTLDWVNSSVLLGDSDIQDATQTISFESTTTIDHVTATGQHDRIESGTAVLNHFATSEFDSAWYLAVNRDDQSNELEVVKHSLVHNNSDAFVSSSASARTGTNNHIVTTADVNSGNARLLGTGSSPENSFSFYRIGLGDSDSTGYAGEQETAIVINTDIDSASEVLDSWAHASYRGAKYYISVNNDSKTELANMEAVVVHDGTNAYITTYNIVNTGNNDLVTLTATINGANVELSAAGLETNLRVHAYRILLADNEADRTGTNVNVIGNVTVSSATTTLDTFDTGSYQAAHYVIVGWNATEGAGSICEAAVVSDGNNTFITQYANTSTKGSDQLTLTASHDGSSTATVSASSTSGGSTVVNAYRVHLTRGAGASTATATLDSVSASTYRAAKYLIQSTDTAGGNYEIIEANVVHNGTTAYINTWGRVGNSASALLDLTADIDSGNLRLRGTINNTNDHEIKVVRRVINV